MAQWSRDEIESAFMHYIDHTRYCAGSGNWSRWAELFTEDVRYHSNGVLIWNGREEVRAGVVEYYSEYPFNHVTDFALNWHVIDETSGRVVFTMKVIMDDPGDGSEFSEEVLIHINFAGKGKWKLEEDYFNPDLFTRMAEDWIEAKVNQTG